MFGVIQKREGNLLVLFKHADVQECFGFIMSGRPEPLGKVSIYAMEYDNGADAWSLDYRVALGRYTGGLAFED